MCSFLREAMEVHSVATIIIPIAVMLFCGFAMTRLTKRLRLPNVTAYCDRYPDRPVFPGFDPRFSD